MSRSELADAINTILGRRAPAPDHMTLAVDARWIGKLERGEFRWPHEECRAALRRVLGAATDEDLGLHRPTRRDS